MLSYEHVYRILYRYDISFYPFLQSENKSLIYGQNKNHAHPLGAIHKRRRNILGGEEGLKFQFCKILEGKS